MCVRFKRVVHATILVCLVALAGCATSPKSALESDSIAGGAGNLEFALNDLTEQIVAGMTEEGKTKVAVIEFASLEGGQTLFGKYLAEELITRLFKTKRFEVVERHLLTKVLNEQELSLSGMVDSESVQELGRILGVEAIVTGTVTDLGSALKVNARIISTETGTVFAVAGSEIMEDRAVRTLMGDRPESGNSATNKQAKMVAKVLPGRWSLNANSWLGYLDISLEGNRISGRMIFTESRSRGKKPNNSMPGELDGTTILFSRVPDGQSQSFQTYYGKVDPENRTITGTFTHRGKSYNWSARKD